MSSDFWLAVGDTRISKEVVQCLEKAALEGRLFLCQISLWEFAQKESKGKIQLNRPLHAWFQENTAGMTLLDLPLEVSIEANCLPGDFHKDPADRMIVATARHHGLTLVTGDGLILAYAASGHVNILAL